jgi:light-harvesting complex II chlorophyll a/b binding protein 5
MKKKKNARKRRKGGVSAVRFKHQCTDRWTILLFFFFFFTTQQNFSGPQRKLYLPSGLLTTADIPSYLDGKLAGDYGFDPLGLGADGAIKQYRVAEVIHARWAMLAVPGIVIPEALNVAGGDWRETGKVFLEGSTGRFGPAELWLGIAVAPLIVLMGGAEKFRSDPASAPSGFVPFKGSFTGSDFAKLDPINPGGPLDFYNVAATPQDLEILKVKEIKNGRLAMIAMLGVFVQGATTGEGPAANWGKHVADPFGYNFVTLNAVDRTPVL